MPELIATGMTVLIILGAIVHILFAVGVYREARVAERGGKIWFVTPAVWAIATLAGGVLVATAFWAMHCSSLRDSARAE
jgi:hypothetical protein